MSDLKVRYGSTSYCEIQKLLQEKKILTTPEAAMFLGISKNYLYQLIHKSKIRSFSPNKKMLYFLREDLEEYMMSNARITEKSTLRKATN